VSGETPSQKWKRHIPKYGRVPVSKKLDVFGRAFIPLTDQAWELPQTFLCRKTQNVVHKRLMNKSSKTGRKVLLFPSEPYSFIK